LSSAIDIFQAFEEHAEVLKARDAMIAALQSSLSAKDMELEVVLLQFFSLIVFYLHRSYPYSFKLWEIWRPLSDERYKPVKEKDGKGRAEKQKSSERGRMEWRTGKEYNGGAIGITYNVFYRNDNEFYAYVSLILAWVRLLKIVFYLHRSYPHSFKLWEIWRPHE